MPEFTPVDALMKGAKEAERYYNYKCNNPDEDGEPARGLQRQAVDLRKHNNRCNLNATSDSWYLHDAPKCDESEENYYICNFKMRRGRKRAKQRVVATHYDNPLDACVKQEKSQEPRIASGLHPLRER